MNNKFLFLILMICGLILSALIIRDGRLLLLTIPFLAYVVVGIVHSPTDITLSAERIINKPNVVAGESAEACLTIKNEGSTLTNLYLYDSSFSGMTVLAGQMCERIVLSHCESTVLTYAFTAARGIYTWQCISAIASDPFGLFERKRDISASGELTVQPASLKLESVPLKPRATLHAPGSVPMRLSGSSADFLGIREYRSGDSLRRLNWRLVARHPHELFTNEYEREEIADFGLILDARRLTTADIVEEALFERSISATLSLSQTCLKAGNRVALLILGETLSALFPGYGKKQLNRITRHLARAKLGSNVPLASLRYLPTRLFPSRSILIVFSPVGMYDYETYARLRSFGYEVILISPDPVDHMAHRLPRTKINDLAVRAARVERVVQLKRLMKLGIQVVDWRTDTSFDVVIQETAKSFSRRRDL